MPLNTELQSPDGLFKTWQAWTQRTGKGVRAFYREHEGWLNTIGLGSVNAWIGWRWRHARGMKIDKHVKPSLPPPRVIDVAECMIVGDVHVPTTDVDMFTRMLMVAKKHMHKPRRLLIIAGDLYNMDAFSSYPHEVVPTTFDDELRAARAFLDDCFTVFTHVYYFPGNHERRLSKITHGQYSMSRLAELTSTHEAFSYGDYGFVTVKSGGVTWRITHAKNYSIQQLNVADALAQKYRTNIIQHHEHHLAIGWDRYGHNVIVNNGGLFNADAITHA